MEQIIDKIIDEIAADKREGATSLALRGLDALEGLSKVLTAQPERGRDNEEQQIVKLARRLDRVRPSMGAIGMQTVITVARAKNLVAEGASWAAGLNEAIRLERETLARAAQTIANLATRELGHGGIISTCSWSITTAKALISIKPDVVLIGEGQGLGDGLRAARWLAARSIKVEVVADAALPAIVADARAVIVGADQVLADGAVVNRCSTFSLALAAHYYGLPFLVACNRIKLTGNEQVQIENNDNHFQKLPDGITGRAPLFDLTPAGLVSRIITENGSITPSEAGEIGRNLDRLKSRLLYNVGD